MKKPQQVEELKRLLAENPRIRGACELDLLLFLYRHPRILLTSEQLASFVGYDLKRVAPALEAFIKAGLLERTLNSRHAARMYVLVLNGKNGGGVRPLLEMLSTPQGRRDALQLLRHERRETTLNVKDVKDEKQRHAVT